MKSTIYAVIVDSISTEVARVRYSGELRDLKIEDIKELLEILAEKDDAWKDVFAGKRAAALFDAKSLERVWINDGNIRVFIQ